MATKKISELTALTSPDGAEELLINDGGTSKKITIDNLLYDESIDSDQYVDGSIDTAHIADDAVTADKLADAINTSIAAKLPLAGGTMTGTVTIDQDTNNEALIIDSEATTDWATKINAKYGLRVEQDVTSGQAVKFTRDLDEAGSEPLVRIIDDHTSNTQPALKIQQDGAGEGLYIDQNGNENALYIDSVANSNAIETYCRYGLYIDQNISDGRAAYFIRNLDEAGALPLVNIIDNHASNTQTALKVTQAGAGHGLHIDQNGNSHALKIDSAATTQNGILVDASALTTGSAAQFYSNSSDNAAPRNLVNIWNDNAAATTTTALYVQQDSTGAAAVFDGNVGIGITSPLSPDTTSTLHLADNIGIGFGTGDGTRADFQIVSTDGNSLGISCGFGAATHDISITTGGNVGIGTTSPQTILSLDENTDAIIGLNRETSGGNGGDLQVRAGAGKGSGNSGGDLYLCSGTGTSSAAVGKIQFGRSSGDDSTMPPDEIWTTIDNTGDVTVKSGNLVIGTAGKGIDFSAQTATATGTTGDEVLDHYEEGTWTGAFAVSSGSVVTNSAKDTGRYTKIGRTVHIQGNFVTESHSSPSGTLTLTGLPFTCGSDVDLSEEVLFYIGANNITNNSGKPLIGYLGTGQTAITIYTSDGDNLATAGTTVNNNGYMGFSFTYTV